MSGEGMTRVRALPRRRLPLVAALGLCVCVNACAVPRATSRDLGAKARGPSGGQPARQGLREMDPEDRPMTAPAARDDDAPERPEREEDGSDPIAPDEAEREASLPVTLLRPRQATARDDAAGPADGEKPDRDDALGPAAAEKPAEPPREITEESRPRAAARYEGTAAPGLQLTLQADGSAGLGLRYRWIQTQGPPVNLDQPDGPTARLTVPTDARMLGFLLVVSNGMGMDSVPLAIPIEGRGGGPASDSLRADAGDDQVGLLGHQITLNGIRSEPRGKLGFRWVQTGGPRVRLKLEEGYIYSFVPAESGTYQFALVVAEGSQISEPDEVRVTVAAGPGPSVTSPAGPGIAPSAVAPAPASPREPETIDRFVRATLSTLDGGPAAADALSRTFAAVVERIDLYRNYDEAFSEMSRRLEAIVPQDPPRRSAWIERLFGPMTARLLEEMRRQGVDLSTPQGRAAELSPAQKARLAEVFRAISDGLRDGPAADAKANP